MIRKTRLLLKLIRPHQFLKNGFVWIPLLFGYKLMDFQAAVHTLYAFFIFCFAAGSIYIINDFADIEFDQKHPQKRRRPLASGEIKPLEAFVLWAVLLTGAITASFVLPAGFRFVLIAYLFLNLAYSFILKKWAIIDVICISLGFVLRVFAGGIAANVTISHWIVIMTFLLSLFLGFAKRRDDLLLSENGHHTRSALHGYNLEFVSLSMIIMASVTIVAYLLYAVSPEIIIKHGTDNMYLTGFWVIAGVLRYLQITFVEQKSGAPTLILIKDIFMQAVILFWLISVYILIYTGR